MEKRTDPRLLEARGCRPPAEAREASIDLSSFRPVSLTRCPCKTVVLHWLEGHRTLPEELSGFRRHRSSMNAVSSIVSTAEHLKCVRETTMAVFLDVKRTYDTVSHVQVFYVLVQAGVTTSLLWWSADFLPDRSISVRSLDGTSPMGSLEEAY